MKVFFDHQIFIQQNYGGISLYFKELIQDFLRRSNVDVGHSILYSNNEYLNESLELGNKVYLNSSNWLFEGHFKGKGKLFSFAKFIGLAKNHRREMENYVKLFFERKNISVFHPTYYDTYYHSFPNARKIPIVVTVYDMIHELFPYYFPADNTYFFKKKTMDIATKIIAISNNTKNDIMKIYNIPEEKIKVIYLAPSFDDIKAKVETDYNLSNSILYVGNRSLYKNFHFFLVSIIDLFRKYPEMNLILAGGEFLSRKEMDLFKKLNLENRITRIAITDKQKLATLYKSSRLFVFPSLYEGFGIPLLEAMQLGCPVVCSNTSSFSEVAGSAALYFDPLDSSSIHDAVENVFINDSFRNQIIEEGYKRCAQFQWENSFAETLDLYNSIL
ncbi:glycosyltransferase family 4 protein [Leptospira sp. WS60.C2]